jgi:NADH-quinone oxidoreductase subunit L
MRRMGGLKKYMPITFATMVAGWLAISGIPFFAGFFSKDEILWKTWSAAGMGSFAKVLWAIGALTALLTAIYMTRMMVMTFWGEERFRNVQPMHHEHEEKDNHHGPTVPHESPWSMTIPLIVLAILSTIGGFIGVPYALVNRDVNVIEHTLEPAVAKMPASETTEHTDEHAHVGEERLLAGVSIGIAFLGIGVGWYLFRRRPLLEMPRILENKYYVDEIYDTTLIRPIEAGSREGLWKIFDIGVIDGTLHALGDAVTELGRLARWLQAGFVRAYAAIILIGALILIGLFAYFGFPLAR